MKNSITNVYIKIPDVFMKETKGKLKWKSRSLVEL